MPRLQVVDPASASGKAKELFDGPLKGMHINIFKGMINSPAVIEAYLGMAGALKGGALGDAEREAIQLVVGQANACDYCVAAHTMLGKNAGLSDEQTVQARKGEIPDNGKMQALTRFAASIREKQGNVSDTDIDAFKAAGYDDGAVAEVVANVALAYFTNFFNHVNQTDVDFPTPAAV